MACFRSQPAAFLRITGPDAPIFLQGQFTNDLKPLSAGESRYGLWLTHKGKVLADSTIIKAGPEEFWIYSRDTAGAVIQKRLEDFIIADDVVVEDRSSDWESAILVGAGAEVWLKAALRVGYIVRGRITFDDSYVWLYPKADRSLVDAALAGVPILAASDLDRLRIQAGVAAVPQDIGAEDLPNEGGLEIDAVSYDKGCYLGQEVMARLKAKGRIRRHLRRVVGPGLLPALPSALYQDGKKVGELRSAAPLETEFVGLALLGVNYNEARPLALEVAGEATVRLDA